MERALLKEVRQLREENEQLWRMIHSLKETNNRLIETYILKPKKKDDT